MSPSLPGRYCIEPGCPNTVTFNATRCSDHGGSRGSAAPQDRGYDAAWKQRAADFLRRHPRCILCGKPATQADHRIPRRLLLARGIQDPDQDQYLQPMCAHCHSRKTREETQAGTGRARP